MAQCIIFFSAALDTVSSPLLRKRAQIKGSEWVAMRILGIVSGILKKFVLLGFVFWGSVSVSLANTPTLEVVSQRLRMLGIEVLLGQKIDDTQLNAIAKNILDDARYASAERLLENTRESLLQALVAELRDSANTITRQMDNGHPITQQSLLYWNSSIEAILNDTADLPENLKFVSSEDTLGEFRRILTDLKATLEAFQTIWKVSDSGSAEALRKLKSEVIDPTISELKKFGVSDPSKEVVVTAYVRSAMFVAPDYKIIRKEFRDYVLKALGAETNGVSRREIALSLIYYTALDASSPPSLWSQLKLEATQRKKALGVGVGIPAAAEILANFLGDAMGTGLGVGGLVVVVALGTKTAKTWNRTMARWIQGRLKENFARDLAIPLGLEPASDFERYDQFAGIICRDALMLSPSSQK